MLNMLSLKNYATLHKTLKELKEKEYNEKYERLLNQPEKENLFLKDEIRRKHKVINILLEKFSNCVQEHSNYMISKNTEISTQTKQQTKSNRQTSTTVTIAAPK